MVLVPSVGANDNNKVVFVPSVGANDSNKVMLVPSVGANDNNNARNSVRAIGKDNIMLVPW